MVFVCQPKNPHPCFAVSTALVAPRALNDSTHEDMFRLLGAKLETWLLLQPPLGSHPFQFSAVQPGSPSWKNVAMPKWIRAEMLP